MKLKQWVTANLLVITGAVVGAVSGYFYWKEIGCISGTCAITSSPWNSTLYFAFMGALLFSIFRKAKK